MFRLSTYDVCAHLSYLRSPNDVIFAQQHQYIYIYIAFFFLIWLNHCRTLWFNMRLYDHQSPEFHRTLHNRHLSWWRHQMETFSALLALCAGNSPVPVNSPHKGQWRGALMFSLICVWINNWVNNREAGDLRRHRSHYDVTVMWMTCLLCC